MLRSILVASLLVGCHTPNPQAPERPVEPPRPSASTVSRPAPVAASAKLTLPSEGPWLDPAFDPWRAVPSRALVPARARLFAEQDGAAIDLRDTAPRSTRVPVLSQQGELVRVLCEGDQARVAVFVQRRELLTVATQGAVLRPSEVVADDSGEPAAGLYLRPGRQLGPAKKQAQHWTVTISEPGLFAEGLVAQDAVSTIFEDVPWTLKRGTPARLRRTAVLSRPGGTRFAEIGFDQDASKLHMVERLAGEQKGHARVLRATPYGVLLGWVKVSDLLPAPSEHAGFEIEESDKSAGDGFGGDANAIRLPRGTLLRAGPDRPSIGVVLEDADLDCHGDCFGPRPRVSVRVCERPLLLEATLAPRHHGFGDPPTAR